MMHTTNPARKPVVKSAKFALLGAASIVGLASLAPALVAQTLGDSAPRGLYPTGGIPVTDDIYRGAVQGVQGDLQPVGTAARSGGLSDATVVRRGRWTSSVSPYVEGTATFSDNINLDPEGFEEEDTILTATGGVDAVIQSERLSGSVGAAVSYDTFVNNTNDDGFRLNGQTAWSAAVVPNLFNVEVGGGVSQIYDTNNDRFSGNPTANSDDRSTAFYGFISPSLRQNIGGWANAELRYTLRGQGYDGDTTIEDNYSQTYRATITSDPAKFNRFSWAAVTEFEQFELIDSDDNRDRDRWSSYVTVDVPVSRTLAVTGLVGYDQFSDDITDRNLDGLYGNAGLRFQPNTRFSSRVYAGYRYDGFDYGGGLTYLPSERLSATASFGRSVQFSDVGAPISVDAVGNGNGRSLFRTPDGGLTDDFNQALATNLATGEQGRAGDPNFAIQSEEAIVDNLSASISGQGQRTSWTATVSGAHRDFGRTADDETIVSASLSAAYSITPRITAEVGAGYSALDVENSRVDDFETATGSIGLSYAVTEIVNVFGRYTYTQRFADLELDEFKENAAVIGVRAQF